MYGGNDDHKWSGGLDCRLPQGGVGAYLATLFIFIIKGSPLGFVVALPKNKLSHAWWQHPHASTSLAVEAARVKTRDRHEIVGRNLDFEKQNP
jgi:hypothetical protein